MTMRERHATVANQSPSEEKSRRVAMPEQKFQSGWVIVPQVRGLRETVYGVKTHYVTAGEGEPLVMIHGGGPGASGASGWANTIPALAKHYRVYALDLIGSGATDIPMIDYSMQTLVEHVAGFIDALRISPVNIMGNSQGAYVAIKYALDHPSYVKKAALLSSGSIAGACGFDAPPGKRQPLPRFDGSKESLRKFIELIVNDKSKVTDELIDTRFVAASRPGHREMLDSLQKYRRLVLEDANEAQVWWLKDRLPKLKVPFCIIWAGNDQTAPLDPMGLDLKKLVPQAPFHVAEGSGHQVQNDKPEKCNRMLLDFFVGRGR
jgi:pimeloyl-ACP methyl ester carboxylesterase